MVQNSDCGYAHDWVWPAKIEHPGIMTHAGVANSPLAVPDYLIRLSVGMEDSQDLIRDLATAMG